MRLRWTRVDTVILVIIAVVGSVLVTGLVIDRLTSETGDASVALRQYTDGVIDGERSAVEAHICPQVWEQVLELPGGFREARSMTLEALPGTVEGLSARRGSAENASFNIRTTGESVAHHLSVIWVDREPQFCPDAPGRLLGSPSGS